MTVNILIFCAGMVLGIAIVTFIKRQKQNRRFNIENQMLKDQAEILKLQKKVADIEAEKKQLQNYLEKYKRDGSAMQNITS